MFFRESGAYCAPDSLTVLTFNITYYPSDGFHGSKYSLGYVFALNAKFVLAKDKNALA